MLFLRDLFGYAERPPARDDTDLVQRIGGRQLTCNQRMPGLVVGNQGFLLVADNQFAFPAEHDLVARIEQGFHVHGFAVFPAAQ